MPEAEPTPEQVVESIYRFVAEQMHNGVAPSEIKKVLIENGLSEETAATVINNMKEAQAQAHKEAGKKNMIFGALWCIGGILVTALTYQAASSGGGSYVVAWGAIVFGAIQFFRGVAQSAGE